MQLPPPGGGHPGDHDTSRATEQPGVSGHQRPSFLHLWWRQSAALLRKSMLIRARSWKLNVAHALQSVAVIFLIWLVEQAMDLSASQFTGAAAARVASPARVAHLPDCQSDIYLKTGVPCWVFLYTPAGNSFVERLVDQVLQGNDPPLPRSAVLGLRTRQEADAWLVANPQRALAALHFRDLPGAVRPAGPGDVKSLAYVLQVNDTVSFFRGTFRDANAYVQLPLQAAVEAAFTRLALDDPDLPFALSTANFPHPSLASSSPAGRVAPVFLLASLMFNVVLLLQSVVGERESGVRGAMTAMGLLDSAYWTSVVVPEALLSLVHAALLTGLATAFGFNMVRHNAPSLLFLLLALSSLALSALALAVSALVRKSGLAVPVALVLFIVAWIFMLVISFGVPFDGSSSPWLEAVFAAFPWGPLAKGLADMSDATTGTARGISWAQRNSYCWAQTPPLAVQAELAYWKSSCSFPLGTALLALLAQAGGYLVIALYLDGVLPQEPGGTSRPWYFPLLPSFWWPGSESWNPHHARAALATAGKQCLGARGGDTHLEGGHTRASNGQQEQFLAHEEDVDVAAEAVHVQQLCMSALGGTVSMQSRTAGLPMVVAPRGSATATQEPGAAAAPPQPPAAPHALMPAPPLPLGPPSLVNVESKCETSGAEGMAPARSLSAPMPAALLTASSTAGQSIIPSLTAAPVSTTTLNSSSSTRGAQSFTTTVHSSNSPMHSVHSVALSVLSSSAGSLRVHVPASHAADLSATDLAYSEAAGTRPTAATSMLQHGPSIVNQEAQPQHLSARRQGLWHAAKLAWSCLGAGSTQNHQDTEQPEIFGRKDLEGVVAQGWTSEAVLEGGQGGVGHLASIQQAPGQSVAQRSTGQSIADRATITAGTFNPQAADLMSGVHLLGLRKVFSRGRRGQPPAVAHKQQGLQHHSSTSSDQILESVQDATGNPSDAAASDTSASWAARVVAWVKGWMLPGRLVAVDSTWLSLEPGTCFCLLGPNGAGKTTTIKCLTGAVSPSAGDALVWGASVRSAGGIARARAVTGVCPQFDVLWPEMTGREHLALFCSIKDVPQATADAQIDTLLAEVSLTHAAAMHAGHYSGGMRRRLSLAIALLGSPKLLVLDEPTTGLDPVSRRAVWALLSQAKGGRCMLLTTHSMEEADVLGDRIGIFAAGRLKCLGPSLRLKARFGDGLRVAVGLQPDGSNDPDTRHLDSIRPADSIQRAGGAVGLPSVAGSTDERVSSEGQPWSTSISASGATCDDQDALSTCNQVAAAAGGGPSHVAVAEGATLVPLAQRVAQLRGIVRDMLARHTPGQLHTQPPSVPDTSGPSTPGAIQEAAVQPAAEKGQAVHPDGSAVVAVAAAGPSLHYERFVVPHAAEAALPHLFDALQASEGTLGVKDLQVGLTSLEEVFLSVTKQ